MIPLPRALQPWEPWLDAFPRDVALALGPWLVRLGLAIGPLRATSRSGSGDLDGFSGLSRRGPYDRLLLTEWLLAAELPDEFDRRAAMHEHLFLDLHRLDPGGRRRAIVLLDAGPDQLGAPRLAHLAAAIVLARRAETAGVPLLLGPLQQPEPVSWTDVGCLTRLLSSRSAERPTAAHLEAWIEVTTPEQTDDLWLIGGHAITRLGAASTIHVEEGEGEPRALRLAVKPLDGPSRPVELALPDDRTAVRLLRDPFERARPIATRAAGVAARGAMWFSTDGRRLLTRTVTAGFAAWHVPNSPRARPVGKAKRFEVPEGHTLVAAGWSHKSVFAITRPADADKLVAWRLEGRIASARRRVYDPDLVPVGEDDWSDLAGFEPIDGDDLPPCLLLRGDARGRQVLFTDALGGLWAWRPEQTDDAERPRARRLHQQVAGLAVDGERAWFVGLHEGERRVYGIGADGVPGLVDLPSLGPGPMQAVHGHGGPLGADCGLYAAPLDDGRWRLLFREAYPSREPRTVDLEVPSGATVYGVLHRKNDGVGLVALDAEGHQLWLVTATDTLPLASDRRRIVTACTSAEHAHVGWRNEDGRLAVWSLHREDYLLDVVPEAP